jgi:hypothetical protein
MPTFRRNILSPSSGLKWRWWIYIGLEEGKAEGVSHISEVLAVSTISLDDAGVKQL